MGFFDSIDDAVGDGGAVGSVVAIVSVFVVAGAAAAPAAAVVPLPVQPLAWLAFFVEPLSVLVPLIFVCDLPPSQLLPRPLWQPQQLSVH